MIGLAREVATKYGTALRPAGRSRAIGAGRRPACSDPLRVTIEDTARCPALLRGDRRRDGRAVAGLAGRAARPQPASARSATSSTSPTTCCSSWGTRCTRSTSPGSPASALHIRSRAGRRDADDARRPDANAHARHARDRRPRSRAGAGRHHGRARQRGHRRRTTTIVLESAWFEPDRRSAGPASGSACRRKRPTASSAAPTSRPRPSALARACALIEADRRGHRPAGLGGRLRRGAAGPHGARSTTRVSARCSAPTSRPADIRGSSPGWASASSPRHRSRGWTSSCPSWRIDVARDVDLVEEVARHYGYDRLPATFPALAQVPPPPDERLEQDRAPAAAGDRGRLHRVRDVLVHQREVGAASLRSRRSRGHHQPALGALRRPAARRCCRAWSMPSRTTGGTGSRDVAAVRAGHAVRARRRRVADARAWRGPAPPSPSTGATARGRPTCSTSSASSTPSARAWGCRPGSPPSPAGADARAHSRDPGQQQRRHARLSAWLGRACRA